MRSINKVWGFLAVGFLLVFAGKVSKASLFTAYVKTIAEVEVRNTQDLRESNFQAEIAILTNKVRALTRLFKSFSSVWSLPSRIILPEPQLVTFHLTQEPHFVYTPSHHFFSSCPIRAPGA